MAIRAPMELTKGKRKIRKTKKDKKREFCGRLIKSEDSSCIQMFPKQRQHISSKNNGKNIRSDIGNIKLQIQMLVQIQIQAVRDKN